MSEAAEGSKRRIFWKAVIPTLAVVGLVAAGWAVSRGGSNEELAGNDIAVDSNDSGDSQTFQREVVEESYPVVSYFGPTKR